MDDQLDPVPLPAQLHRHRVDDERHVVADDLDHRERRVPAVTLNVGVIDAHLGLASRTMLAGLPVGHHRPAEVQRIAVGEIRGGNPVVVLAYELGVRGGGLARQPLSDAVGERVDQIKFEVPSLHGHIGTISPDIAFGAPSNLPLRRRGRVA